MIPSALITDLYELTMMAGYDAGHVRGRATYELFVRSLPPNRAYLLAAGLEQALQYLETLRFTPEQVAWLRHLPNLRTVPSRFFDETLPNLRFTGNVWAVPEGTPVFGYEPLLRVTAPAMEAQLVETALLAVITFQTTIASKAARIVGAADGRAVMEFGSRRAHGPEAGVLAARAAYIAGCESTSNVEAGYRFGIPLSGTMAHSWVTTFDDEIEAFRAYASVFGEGSVFLIDTYDTVECARKIVASGLRPRAVRLDSGEQVALSQQVRAILDEGGLRDTKILASGDLDEWSIADALARGAAINGFGVGTALATSKDAPALGGIYKLVEVEREGVDVPVMKLSAGGKSSLPGLKQVWRHYLDGHAVGDVIGLADEATPAFALRASASAGCAPADKTAGEPDPRPPAPDPERATGVPLMVPVMERGFRLGAPEALDVARARCARMLAELPPSLRALDAKATFPVSRSAALEALTERTAAAIRAG